MSDDKLVWLHISDIHFQPSKEWRDSPGQDALIEYLLAEFEARRLPRPDFVFCTGDIAFGEMSGAPIAAQYEKAKLFFKALIEACNVPLDHLFVVPGNHDVNRKGNDEAAQFGFRKMAEKSHEFEEQVNQSFSQMSLMVKRPLERMDAYGTFCQSFLPHQHQAAHGHVYARVVEWKGRRIGIGGFNSAWSCSGDEDSGALWLAAKWQFDHVKNGLKGADVCFGLMHHPISWSNEAEQEVARARIERFDVWLHGHAHNAWVTPGVDNVTIGAGAVSARDPEEFGINLCEVDLNSGNGFVHLRHFGTRGGAWKTHTIEVSAPDGNWPFKLKPLPAPQSEAPSPSQNDTFHTVATSPDTSTLNPASQSSLFGRAKLLVQSLDVLRGGHTLALCGFRGNGKSALIRALIQSPVVANREMVRISARSDDGIGALFQPLTQVLGERAENPKMPIGSVAHMAAQLRERYPDIRPALIWVDMAHHWLGTKAWYSAEIATLFQAMQQAFGQRLMWILELRERPGDGVLGNGCTSVEVPGLDKASLADFLADAAPPDDGNSWSYSGDNLKRLYQWLGGGHGQQAHPLATRLLIEVARGQRTTPLSVLEKMRGKVEGRVEVALLRDLFYDVLSQSERILLEALSLYRDAIPHDHLERLEVGLPAVDAWSGLDKRCVLASDAIQHQFFLHGFIAEWVRHHIGYAESDESPPCGSAFDFVDPARRSKVQRLHGLIADCWLHQLGGSRKVTRPNIERAIEAFHHCLSAGRPDKIQGVASALFGGSQDWICRQLWAYYDQLYAKRAAVEEQICVLSLITQLSPYEDLAWRFLGENWRKSKNIKRGQISLDCFERALRLNPVYPPHLANLGQALKQTGRDGAADFLRRLAQHAVEYPSSMDDYVTSIAAECETLVGEIAAASKLRCAQMEANSTNPAIYVAEAEYQLEIGDISRAIEILDKVDRLGCGNSYTLVVRAKAIQLNGDGAAASALRLAQIRAREPHPAVYVDEAEYQLGLGDTASAMLMIDQAETFACRSPYTLSMRAKIMEASGDGAGASDFRYAQIAENSTHPALYNAEAEYQIMKGDNVEALRLLDLAATRGCVDSYTPSIRAKALAN